jgi:tryptophanyl-tRNA synthetase
MEDAKDPETDHLFSLLRLVAQPAEIEEVGSIYRRGGFGYGDIKKRLADAAENYFADARARRTALESTPDYVSQVLAEGAETARRTAGEVLAKVQKACGVSKG